MLQQIFDWLQTNITWSDIIGIFGGLLFFFSWVLQAWESKKAGRPIVSMSFFVIRLIGSLILLSEAIKVRSPALIFVYVGIIAMIFYNMYIIKMNKIETK